MHDQLRRSKQKQDDATRLVCDVSGGTVTALPQEADIVIVSGSHEYVWRWKGRALTHCTAALIVAHPLIASRRVAEAQRDVTWAQFLDIIPNLAAGHDNSGSVLATPVKAGNASASAAAPTPSIGAS